MKKNARPFRGKPSSVKKPRSASPGIARPVRSFEEIQTDCRSLAFELRGAITNAWSMIDMCVDEMLIVACSALVAEGNKPKIQWGQLSAKLDSLATICRDLSPLGEESDALELACTTARELYVQRNDLIHGMVSVFGAGDDQILVTRWKGENSGLRIWRVRTSLEKLLFLKRGSDALAQQFHDFRALWEQINPTPEGTIISEALVIDS